MTPRWRIPSWTVAIASFIPAGCGVIPTSEEISRTFLFPDLTCTETAENLGVPAPFEPTDPTDIGLPFESFTATTSHGATIAGWYLPPVAGDGNEWGDALGTVLLLHGNSGSRACTLPWLATITSNGYAAVTFDYQGFGESTVPADLATLFADAEAALRWTLADEASPPPIHLLGVSLGAGPAIALAQAYPEQIASVALDGAFDPRAQLTPIAHTYGVPEFLVELYARNVFTWLFNARDRLGETQTPALFLNAELDQRSGDQARALYEAWGAPRKSYWVFTTLTHVQPVFYAESDYAALLTTFWAEPDAEPAVASGNVYRE